MQKRENTKLQELNTQDTYLVANQKTLSRAILSIMNINLLPYDYEKDEASKCYPFCPVYLIPGSLDC